MTPIYQSNLTSICHQFLSKENTITSEFYKKTIENLTKQGQCTEEFKKSLNNILQKYTADPREAMKDLLSLEVLVNEQMIKAIKEAPFQIEGGSLV